MNYRTGMVLEGKVTGIQPYGAFVALDDSTQGLIHISECHNGYVEDIHHYLKVGQKVKVMIIDIDEFTGKISLSVRCLERQFDFERHGQMGNQRKHYWTTRKVTTGFAPIEERLTGWVDEALDNIEQGK